MNQTKTTAGPSAQAMDAAERHDDGKAVYSDYTAAELMEAAESINPARYPANFKRLLGEISNRPEFTPEERAALLAKADASTSHAPKKNTRPPVTLNQLVFLLVASVVLFAHGTYGLYKDDWHILTRAGGEHLHGRDALAFYLVIATAMCTNALRLASWIRNGHQEGSMFRFGTEISFVAIAAYLFYMIFSGS